VVVVILAQLAVGEGVVARAVAEEVAEAAISGEAEVAVETLVVL
jgi:hypothetical protein